MTNTVSNTRKALNEYVQTQLENADQVYACATPMSDPDDQRVAEGVCELFLTPEDHYDQRAELKREWWAWHMATERPKCGPCREWEWDRYHA